MTRTVAAVMHVFQRITWRRQNLMSRMSPTRMTRPHPPVWMPRTPRMPPDRSGVHGLAIEGQGGKRNMGPGIKSTLSTLTGMRITELITPCGDTAPLFPGTPSKCLTMHSIQNPPANAPTAYCSIRWDFSHWIFSIECGHVNFLTTLLMKRIKTTMRERIITDDAVSTLSCFSLYFYDVMNIFTQCSRALRSVCCTRGCVGLWPGRYPQVPQSVYMFHTSIVFYISTNTHIVKRRIFPHKFVAISVEHGKAFLTETYNTMRVQRTVASEAVPGQACLPGPMADSVLKNDHTQCTSFPPKHRCTQTWSSTQNMFTNLLAYQ